MFVSPHSGCGSAFFRGQSQLVEAVDLIGYGNLSRKALHRTGAVETIDAWTAIEDKLGVFRRGDGSAVTEDEAIRALRLAGIGDRLDLTDAVLQCLRRSRADA